MMCYYLIKSFELDSTVADAIVKHRFNKKLPISDSLYLQISKLK